MTRGARPCFFSSLRSRRLAARLSRRFWTRTSSTNPSWSTARQRALSTWLLAGDLHLDLVQVPLVSGTGEPAPDLVGEALAELARPLAHGLVAHDDAAGRQHLFHHAQAQREPEVQPNG